MDRKQEIMILVREANRPDPKLAVPIAGDGPEALQVASGLVRDGGSSASSRSRADSSAASPAMASR